MRKFLSLSFYFPLDTAVESFKVYIVVSLWVAEAYFIAPPLKT